MPNILVIGATGVAGTAAILASRDEFGREARITGVWHGHGVSGEPAEGLDAGIEGDVSAPDFVARLRQQAGGSFDYLFFATAVGDVGFPVNEATPEQIEKACRISFDPLVRLASELRVGRAIGYSTFYTLPHQRVNYGAMGPAKEKLERWVAEPGAEGQRACIRAGAFASASSRAIKLMLRRRARQLSESSNPLLRKLFENRKSSEAVAELERIVQQEERDAYGDTGTSADDLRAAHRMLFRSPSARFVNVCGRRIWITDVPELL